MESASTTSSGSVRSGPALQHPGVILIFAIISDDFVNLDIFDRVRLRGAGKICRRIIQGFSTYINQ